MSRLWSLLVARIRAGAMEYEEALRRDNYYSFVKEIPDGVLDPIGYVLDTPYDELPPYTVAMCDEHSVAYRHFIECVRDGSLSPFEAAEEYYRVVGG